MSKRSKKLTKDTVGRVTAAIDKYSMIEDNDKIAVAVSGGKDSVFLLYSLAILQGYYNKKFSIVALTLDSLFNDKAMDLRELTALCKKFGIQYKVKTTELGKLIFKDRQEANPCSLCSKMRKGILNDLAKEYGCNKIAVGHTYDDVIQTFIMNLFNCGKIGCFSPVTYLSRKDIFMIRPLIFCRESEITKAVKRYELPICKSTCPVDKKTNRTKTEELIVKLENLYPDIRAKIMGALQRADIDGWGFKNIIK